VSRSALGVAGMGIASPIGIGKAAVAHALFAGTRGLIPRDDLIPERTVHVGEVTGPLPPVPPPLQSMDCRNDRLMLASVAEIAEAVEEAARKFGRDRIAVVLGTSTSGIAEGEAAYEAVLQHGVWPADFHYRQQEPGNLGEFVASTLGLTGPAYTIATACSSSGKAFAAARRLMLAGLADAAVVGGADTLCRMTVGGFAALEAMSGGLCSPFSRNRDGINVGEAAAVFLLTRDVGPVQFLGVGESSDAHHISAPDPDGRGALMAMRAALDDAGLTPADIAYVNLHGTGTTLNDAMEGKAVHAVFGAETPCSSTKAMTGHTLGAAAACEAAFLWLALHPEYNPDGHLPPHLWDGEADPSIPPLALADVDTRLPEDQGRVAMLSNSFAFGGSNVALVLARGDAH
jgi:3-oxoacyl-[acyl-carrier-protein] synthase I